MVYTYEEQKNILQSLYFFVPKLMTFLWEDPKLLSKLLLNSDINDVKKYLAPFIVNDFYLNILSSNLIENNLMYVLTLILKKEIENLEKKEDYINFLEDSVGGYLLEQLNSKGDIKYFFKTTIYSVMEKLELGTVFREINFNIKEIQENFEKMQQILQSHLSNSNKENINFIRHAFSNSINNIGENVDSEWNNALNDQKKNEVFNMTYLTNIGKEELEKLVKDYDKNKDMREYCNMQLQIVNEKPKIFSNDPLLNSIYDSPMSKEVLALYQIDFFKVVSLINELFKSFLNNLYLIPYSVKCICKIILLLIKKKFPDINTIEQNAFMSKFFFYKLFLPILRNPDIGALINNFIISGRTIHNLKIINIVIEKFVSGEFFIDNEQFEGYTPFNQYFLEEMPELLNIFNSITNVKLPFFIERLINDQLTENYNFDYFKEDPEEMIFYRSICFNFECLLSVLSNMEKCQTILFENDKNVNLQKTFEKLTNKSSKECINEIKSQLQITNNRKKTKKVKEEKKKEYYFLFTDLLINEKYQNLFSISQERPNFTLKELKTTSNEIDREKNNIIKVKNFISTLLYNYRTLIKTDFNPGTTLNMVTILTELKKFMKISNYVIDENIPSIWYVNSLIEYLRKLPPDLRTNDYENLFKQIELDLRNSIKELDFENMSVCLGKLKFAQKIKTYYEKTKNIIKDIEINKQVQSIIETASIPVCVKMTYSEKSKEFTIEKSRNKDIQRNSTEICIDNFDPKNNICGTIESFTKKFPNIVKMQQLKNTELFKLEEEIKLSETISNYINLIKEHLKKFFGYDESQKEFENIINKIYDYIMEKIYEKIYTDESNENDTKIFKKCILLSWTEPKHFIQGKTNYIYDSFLPDVINYFQQIEKEKSPRKKILAMKNIFICINNVIKFNGSDDDAGVDDLLPILNYVFIKAKPLHIFSICKYIELFLGDMAEREEGNQLSSLFGICTFVMNLSADQLNDVSEEIFNKKCMIAAYNND